MLGSCWHLRVILGLGRPRWSAGGRAGSTAVGTRPEHAVLCCMSLLAVPKAAFGCLARAYTHQTAEDGGLQVAPGSPSRCRTRMRPPFCFSQHTHRRGGLRGFHVHRGMTSEGESRHLARPDPIQLDQHAPRRIGTLLRRAGKGWKGREWRRIEAGGKRPKTLLRQHGSSPWHARRPGTK